MATTRKPEVIVREIEQTRAELAQTIDAITERLNPRRAATRSVRAVKEQVSSALPDEGVSSVLPGEGPRPAVIAAAGAAAVVAGVIAVRRRR